MVGPVAVFITATRRGTYCGRRQVGMNLVPYNPLTHLVLTNVYFHSHIQSFLFAFLPLFAFRILALNTSDIFLRHPTSPEFDICFNTVILASFGLFHLLSDEGLLEPIGQNLRSQDQPSTHPLRQELPILGHLLGATLPGTFPSIVHLLKTENNGSPLPPK
jgi:hypothetical protein